MNNYVNERDFEKRVQEEVSRRMDREVNGYSERDGERLAVLEVQIRHMSKQLDDVVLQVDALNNTLMKASGVKIAGLALLGGLGFIVSQAWNYISYKH